MRRSTAADGENRLARTAVRRVSSRLHMVDDSSRGRRSPWWQAGALLAIGVIVAGVFREAVNAAFVNWDDDINILLNEHLRGLTWDNVRWMFTDTAYIRRYAPLAWLDWAIDHQFFGLTERSAHVGNLLFHLANSCLVFLVIRKVLRLRPAASPGQGDGVPATIAAMAGTLLWAIHPLRVEVVAWASGRIYCQAAFFLFLAVLAYLEAFSDACAARRRGWLAASVLLLSASLLTYPLAVTFVGVLLVLDGFLFGRFRPSSPDTPGAGRFAVWLEKIPFAAVTLAVLAVTVWARLQAKDLWQPPPTLAEFGLGPRVMQAFYIWGYYVWKPLVPFDLSPAYSTLVWFRPTDLPFVLSLLLVLAVTAYLVVRRRAHPGLLALWLCHLVVLAPMLGYAEHPHYANDRYSYLQAAPWSVGLSMMLTRLWFDLPRRRALAVALSTLVLVTCAMLTAVQVKIWRNSETLFHYMLGQIGDSRYRADLYKRLGAVYLLQGRVREAVTCLRESLRIDPSSRYVREMLAEIAKMEGATPADRARLMAPSSERERRNEAPSK